MSWTIEKDGKTLMLDYETTNLMRARPIIKAYQRYDIDYFVKKDCWGVYHIYAEKTVWNPVEHDLHKPYRTNPHW